MSTDYRFTIKRKADGKKLGEFYYNRIKSLYDVYAIKLTVDPESFTCSEDCPVKFTVDDIQNDICKLDYAIKAEHSKIVEKKLMVLQASNVELKDAIEADIAAIEENISYLHAAIQALAGLNAVVNAVVEDMVKDSDDSDSSMAYVYNAEGLKSPDGNSIPHIWSSDVNIEALACC